MGFLDFFKSLDYFGAQINFNFKNEKKYTSFSGGLIFVIYVILCVSYVTINFIYFLQKKHKTVIYYDKELFKTDDIYFHKYNTSFAINMICNDNDGNLGDFFSKFKIEANHVKYIKTNGTSKKYKTSLSFHKCTYDDFFNQFNDELDVNKIPGKYNCIDDKDYLVKGIFADEDFEYFELILSATCENGFDNRTYLEKLYKYDCKFSLYYIDSAVDVANVTHPKSSFLTQKFIQLSPVEFKKVNLYYTIKSFKSDENWFFNWPTEENYMAFSYSEEYDIYKGENRFISNYQDNTKFATYYIRASNSRNMIERRYEKFTEFVASSTSILSAIFLFLFFIVSNINNSFALKEIIDIVCIDEKTSLGKKIKLKTIFINNSRNLNKINYRSKFNTLRNEESNNINEKEEKSPKNKELDKSQNNENKLTYLGGNIEKEDNNIYCDYTQSKMNLVNDFNILNCKRINIKAKNFIINEIKNKAENNIPDNCNVHKIKYDSFKNNNYKNQNLTEIFNKIINKNEDNSPMSISGQKFKLDDEQKKHELLSENRYNIIINHKLNESNDEKIKDKFNLLDNNLHSSILNYKFCRFFSYCRKHSKNNDLILESSLNYLMETLDIFTYFKLIKKQDILVNILFDLDSNNLIKKLVSLNFNNNNIFNDYDKFYELNKEKKRKSNFDNLEDFWKVFVQLTNKINKTQMEQGLVELIVKKINDI